MSFLLSTLLQASPPCRTHRAFGLRPRNGQHRMSNAGCPHIKLQPTVPCHLVKVPQTRRAKHPATPTKTNSPGCGAPLWSKKDHVSRVSPWKFGNSEAHGGSDDPHLNQEAHGPVQATRRLQPQHDGVEMPRGGGGPRAESYEVWNQ